MIINYDNEMTYITDWITRHMQYLDREVFPVSTSTINTVNVKYKGNRVYNLNGQLINKNSNSINRLLISNGKKVIRK